MKIRDLIDELIQMESETSPGEEVFVELKVSSDQTWFGCLIEGTGHDEEGCIVLRAVTP